MLKCFKISWAMIALATFLPQTQAGEHEHRGHRWVRRHPFTIMGMVRMTPKPFDIKQYRAAGFNSLLAWEPGTYEELLPIASADQMPFHVHLEKWGEEEANRENSTEQSLRDALRKLDSDETRNYVQNILKHRGCTGFLVNDEAVRPTWLRYTRHALKWLRTQHPDALVYGNSHPEGYDGDFARYIDEFAAIVNPDVLMTDYYPLSYPDGTAKTYFKVIAALRSAALEHGMPYWMFIQSFETHQGFDRRHPSESDLRFQLFSLLTYGFTGVVYFTYDVGFERGLIEPNGEPNALHHAAAKANAEVASLGKSLRFLTSTDVRIVQGRHEEGGSLMPNSLPIDTFAWTPGAGGDKAITNVVVESHGEGKDGLIGFFQDDRGDQYFMLTNLWHNGGASASERTLSFTMNFASDVKKLYRLNRATGVTEPVMLTEGVLHLELPGGTGDLFKYSDQTFPGVN